MCGNGLKAIAKCRVFPMTTSLFDRKGTLQESAGHLAWLIDSVTMRGSLSESLVIWLTAAQHLRRPAAPAEPAQIGVDWDCTSSTTDGSCRSADFLDHTR